MGDVEHCPRVGKLAHRPAHSGIGGVDGDADRRRDLSHEQRELDVLQVIVIHAQQSRCLRDVKAIEGALAGPGPFEVASAPARDVRSFVDCCLRLDDDHVLTGVDEMTNNPAGHALESEDDDVTCERAFVTLVHQAPHPA